MTTSPAVEECGHSWTPIAPPEPYPYPDGLICCAFRDRPFEIMPEARCHQASAQALQWPKWEAEHGCVAPPDSGPNHPICCLTMIGDQVTDVKQLPFRMCPSSDQAMPFSWCELYRCIDGPAPANYPDSSLGGLPGDNSVHSPPGVLPPCARQAPRPSRGRDFHQESCVVLGASCASRSVRHNASVCAKPMTPLAAN